MSPPILVIEPFYGGSHRQLADLLCAEIPDCDLYTLPAKKWPWRARTSALYFSQVIPRDRGYSVLLCSSVLNLSDLVSLRPDLARTHKVVYYHENQLVYPTRDHGHRADRDFTFGYNQILTALVADAVVFNSHFNKDSFLSSIQSFLKLIPDHRPKNLAEQIRPKCSVAYFPIQFPQLSSSGENFTTSCDSSAETAAHNHGNLNSENSDVHSNSSMLNSAGGISVQNSSDDLQQACCAESNVPKKSRLEEESSSLPSGVECLTSVGGVSSEDNTAKGSQHLDDEEVSSKDKCKKPLVIGWAHRWEHDKNPELFFQTLYKLKDEGLDFRLVVMGESYSEVPCIFPEALTCLRDTVLCWGYQATKADYYRALHKCDVSVSTARHEFFGVAMLESVSLGCYPLVPNNLVYPEIFPKECLYNTDNQLLKRLRQFCRSPHSARARRRTLKLDLSQYSWSHLRPQYEALLTRRAETDGSQPDDRQKTTTTEHRVWPS